MSAATSHEFGQAQRDNDGDWLALCECGWRSRAVSDEQWALMMLDAHCRATADDA